MPAVAFDIDRLCTVPGRETAREQRDAPGSLLLDPPPGNVALMSCLRRVLGPLVVAGLLLQAAIVGAVAGDVWMNGGVPVGTLLCTCAHLGDHGECPMHHGSPKSTGDTARCRMRGTQPASGDALMSLLASLAMPTVSVAAIPSAPDAGVIAFVASHPIDPAFSPDAPPPRS